MKDDKIKLNWIARGLYVYVGGSGSDSSVLSAGSEVNDDEGSGKRFSYRTEHYSHWNVKIFISSCTSRMKERKKSVYRKKGLKILWNWNWNSLEFLFFWASLFLFFGISKRHRKSHSNLSARELRLLLTSPSSNHQARLSISYKTSCFTSHFEDKTPPPLPRQTATMANLNLNIFRRISRAILWSNVQIVHWLRLVFTTNQTPNTAESLLTRVEAEKVERRAQRGAQSVSLQWKIIDKWRGAQRRQEAKK